jgi:hypothetical protein
MRSEYFEKEKTARRQRGLLKLSALLRGSGAHSPCNVHVNHDEAGIASNSRFSAGLVNLGNYFLRVGDCENRTGINCHAKDRWCDPTVRFWKRMPRADFFSRVDSCENQLAQWMLQSIPHYPTRRALLSSFECNVHVVELGVFSQRMSYQPSCGTRH